MLLRGPMILTLALSVLIIIAGFVLNLLFFKIFARRIADQEEKLGISFRNRFYMVFRLLVPVFLLILLIQVLPVPENILSIVRKTLGILFIASFGWLTVNVVLFGRDLVLRRYDVNVKDNLKARAVHTQINILVKILVITVVLISAASCLMIFDNVRQVGTSILASAGVIGIIIGFAAQKSIATLLAGLQLAITQPIRIDDVVIVDGEWGQIEEITLTYVVVRIWDLRRLVVPTNYFLEKSFQNWTRTSADLLGSVTIHADYSVPIEELRKQLYEVIKNHQLWDGKVWRLHVINTTDRTVELRALVSAANASDAWELRCDVREKLLGYLQMNYPDCLPKIRAEVRDRSHDLNPGGKKND